MLALKSPHEAYRRVDFDARVAGADSAQLVRVCYEQLIGAVGSVIYAGQTGDNRLKSQSLTRALSAVTALQLGVSGDEGVAKALRQFYEATRRTLLDSALEIDSNRLGTLRQDFVDILTAMDKASS